MDANALSSAFIALAIALIISVALFLLFRFLVLWYWKVNERLLEQQKQTALLKKILEKLEKE